MRNFNKALITGAHGLVGSEAVKRFCEQGCHVIGIDNNMRAHFFGEEASTKTIGHVLQDKYPNYFPINADIRNRAMLETIYKEHGSQNLIIHTAAQPAHEYSTRQSSEDFEVNALGTFNMLETFRQHSPEAVFIQVSTSKVYGDHVNSLPLEEYATRFDLPPDHPAYEGTDETMSVEGCLHSLFGASKLAGDVMAQEYGRYLGLQVAIFRPVCITGPQHMGAPLHGYLAYLVKCIAEGIEYTINGYGGKQVRDNIHAYDLVAAFDQVWQHPEHTYGEVYNIGGGRASNNSILEAIRFCEDYFGKVANIQYSAVNRRGDHKWCIFNAAKFKARYPDWRVEYDNEKLMSELCRGYLG